MNIKLPPVYDVSHWKEIPDFKAISPRPILMITKATEAYPELGYKDTDEKFIRFMTDMMEIECIRGAYHFFRKFADAKRQAEHFINIISKIDILPTDILVLDVEEGGETASQLWVWFETVKRAYPNLLMLYSRKNILDPIAMTYGEKEYFRKIPIWTAGYPYFPDLYSAVPASYIPDRSKFGPGGLWQYSSHGKVTGIIGDVDLNWISPEFQAVIGSQNIGEKIMAAYTGRCITTAKVWKSIGGERVYPDITIGTSIIADAKQGEYLHLTSPVIGWSKAVWYQYSIVDTPPPPPNITKTHDIDVYSDGS